MNNLGIIAALQPEVQDLLNNPVFKWQQVDKGVYKSAVKNIHLVISGIGKAFAVYALSKVIHKVDTILIIGTSGGLNDEKIGCLYLSTEFVEHDMDGSGLGFAKGVTPLSEIKDVVFSYYTEDTVLKLQNICTELGIEIYSGRTISGDQFLIDPQSVQEKKTLFNAHLVDMESAAIAKICVYEKREVIALRYISDNANHDSKIDWNENVKKSSYLSNRILEQAFKKAHG
jgi:adenosylhomocysteine nucleosidase